MADEPELAIVAKLTRRVDGYPQTGRCTIDATGRGTVEMDPAPQVLVNPDGPEAAAIIKELVEAGRNLADSVLAYCVKHDTLGAGHTNTGRAWDLMKRREGEWSAILSRTGAKQ